MLSKSTELSFRPRRGLQLQKIVAFLAALTAMATVPLAIKMYVQQQSPLAPALMAAPATVSVAFAAALDQEMKRQIDVLTVFATSPLLDQPTITLSGLDAQARAVASIIGAPVTIADNFLTQLINTAVGFGTLLPGLASPSAALTALETQTIAVTAEPPEQSAGTSVALAVPVMREGASIAIIAAEIDVSRFEDILKGAARNGSGFALFDQRGHLVGSSSEIRQSILHSAIPLIEAAIHEGESGSGTTTDGISFAYAVQPLKTIPNWKVAIFDEVQAQSIWPTAMLNFLGVAAAALFSAFSVIWIYRSHSLIKRDDEIQLAEVACKAALDRETEALRRLSELNSLHDTIPVGLAFLGRDLRFRSVNAKLVGVSGILNSEHYGRHPSEVFPANLAEAMEDAHHSVLVNGRPVIEIPLSSETAGEIKNFRHFLASFHPVHDRDGRIEGVAIVMQDVTERVRAEQGRDLLVRELNHRVKNTLSSVQAIISGTLRRSAATPQQINRDIVSRLRALARAHDLLLAHAWEAADLTEVVSAALDPWLEGTPARLTIDGPRGIPLRPAQVKAVILALHELATNATKHGALSSEEGRIKLRWSTNGGRQTTLEWIEVGGPVVVEPAANQRGFGTRLLERALVTGLGTGSKVQLDFAPNGLQARIYFSGAATSPDRLAA
jgi:PAS domain S-box-containing protein